MNKNLKVMRVLVVARDALTRYGWIKGQMGSTKLGFCASGAVRYATDDFKLSAAAVTVLSRNFTKKYARKYPGTSPISYNDASGRNLGQILAWFDRAINAAAGR